MKLKILAIRDQKTDAYMNPIPAQTPGQLVRQIQDQMQKEPNDMINLHAEDFELFEVGEFDTDTGELKGHAPKSVILLQDLKAKA